jgi:hypothetical protein
LNTAKLEKKLGALIFILLIKKIFFLNKQLKLENKKKPNESNVVQSSTTTYLGT